MSPRGAPGTHRPRPPHIAASAPGGAGSAGPQRPGEGEETGGGSHPSQWSSPSSGRSRSCGGSQLVAQPQGLRSVPRLLTAEGGPDPTQLWPKDAIWYKPSVVFHPGHQQKLKRATAPRMAFFCLTKRNENHLPAQGSCRDSWWLTEKASSTRQHHVCTVRGGGGAHGGGGKGTSIQGS